MTAQLEINLYMLIFHLIHLLYEYKLIINLHVPHEEAEVLGNTNKSFWILMHAALFSGKEQHSIVQA